MRVVLVDQSLDDGWVMVPRPLLFDDRLSAEDKLLYISLHDCAMRSFQIERPNELSFSKLVETGWATSVQDSILLAGRFPQVVDNVWISPHTVVDNVVEKTELIHKTDDLSRAHDNEIVVVDSSQVPIDYPNREVPIRPKLSEVNTPKKPRRKRYDDGVIDALIEECDVVFPDDKDIKEIAIASSRLIKRWIDENGGTKEDAVAVLPSEIHERSIAYRGRWPKAELTPWALVKHWHRVATPRQTSSTIADDVQLARQMEERGLL